jgi:hypothetical protein
LIGSLAEPASNAALQVIRRTEPSHLELKFMSL